MAKFAGYGNGSADPVTTYAPAPPAPAKNFYDTDTASTILDTATAMKYITEVPASAAPSTGVTSPSSSAPASNAETPAASSTSSSSPAPVTVVIQPEQPAAQQKGISMANDMVSGTVTQASPLRVVGDGATVDHPAAALNGATYLLNARVVILARNPQIPLVQGIEA